MTFRKSHFPILFKKPWNVKGLADAIASVNPNQLRAEYRALVECAPHRADRGKTYFVCGHDGILSSGVYSNRCEEHYAIALWNLKTTWPRFLRGDTFSLLDYQVPLKAKQTDDAIGKIDLVGVTSQGRLMVIELKVKTGKGRGDAPPVALMEGLRYAALVEANHHAIAKEAGERFGITLAKGSPIVQLLAPMEWWDGWLELGSQSRSVSGDWETAFARLIRGVEAEIGVTVECRALEDAQLTMGLNGQAPTLDRVPALYPVRPDESPPVLKALPRHSRKA